MWICENRYGKFSQGVYSPTAFYSFTQRKFIRPSVFNIDNFGELLIHDSNFKKLEEVLHE